MNSSMYDELDEQIIDALTIDPRVQWSDEQRKAVKALITDRITVFEEEQLYKIARWVAKHNNYAWSKMTDGEKREEIEFAMEQAPYKELLLLIAGLKSV